MADEKEKAPDGPKAPASSPKEDDRYIWVISNRTDDRVVLHERDPRHPGGEAFIGGPTPDKVFRTGEIDRLLHSGEIVQVPEPLESKKKPVPYEAVVSHAPTAQPGQPIKLGRKLDPELFPEGAIRRVESRQQQLPQQINSKATVPPAPKDLQTQNT